jgi:lysophospholipid acyltransferase (LPLAT)-like uncharacterized protein
MGNTAEVKECKNAQVQSRSAILGPVVPHRAQGWKRTAAWAAFAVERILATSWRCRWHDFSGLIGVAGRAPVIFCIWHNRLALSMVVHRKFPSKLAALISASKDGAFLAAVLLRHGVEAVRGSTSRRGPQALLELKGRMARGYDTAITPDGPRGPRYVVQEGILHLAEVTGLPIVPVTCNTRRKICLKSWDGFQIPLPFALCELVFHPPMLVPSGISAEGREDLRAALQAQMREGSRD